jgi:chemotaxis protein methyltransferase CheR
MSRTNLNSRLWDTQQLHADTLRDAAGFERLSLRLKHLAGLEMPTTEKNITLMSCRLNPILRRRGLHTYSEYEKVLDKGDSLVIGEFISAMTTHTTHFFREPSHFTLLPKLLPDLIKARSMASKGPLRVWCAAASSGQEPYTILMTLLEAQPKLAPDALRFLATDIDRAGLIRAADGSYSRSEVTKLPGALQKKYFYQTESPNDLAVKEEYRRLITFAEFNLMMDSYPFQHKFDIIFCRNVLIYFSHEDSAEVCRKLALALEAGGLIFLAHAEVALIRQLKLNQIAPAVFQKA